MQSIKPNLALAALVSGALFLSACSSTSTPPTTTTPATPATTTSSTETVAPEAAESVTEAQIKSDSEIAASALDENSLKRCDEIKLENIKGQCRYNVVVSSAYKKSNPALCEQLSDPLEVDNCKMSLKPLAP